LAAALPTGIGILVLGPDRVTVRGNEVEGNDFLGVGVGSALIMGLLGGIPAAAYDGLDPDANEVRVEANALTDNGANPSIPFFPAADLIWDGTGTGNCWADNAFGASEPETLPVCRDGSANQATPAA
jgi:hypothetical protein